MTKRGQGDGDPPRSVPVKPAAQPARAPDSADRAGPGAGGSGWGQEPARRSKKGQRRITLELGGAPLALPGETDETGGRRSAGSSGAWPALDASSALLALPPELRDRSTGGEPTGPRSARGDATEPQLGLDDDVGDGWGRSIEAPSPAMTRPRSVTPPPMAASEALESNDALSLIAQKGRRPSNVEAVDFRREMLERFALGDFTGALRAAEILLGRAPDDAQADECAGHCRDKLAHFYLARLGGGRRRLEVAVRAADVRWLGIDHRAGFLLSHVDGTTTLDDVVDVSGMPRHEALKLLVELFEAGAVRLL